MATKTTTSPQFSLNWKDFIKGLILAVLVPVVNVIIQSLEAGNWTFDWARIGILALSALLAYLLKNFLSPTQIVIENPSPASVEAVKKGAEAKVTTTNHK